MSYSDLDCVCVQGIEHFIAPQPTSVSYEPLTFDNVSLSPWQQKEYDAFIKAQEEQTAEQSKKNAVVESSMTLPLYVQGLKLVLKEFTHLVAYQTRSFYVTLESLDSNWIKKPVSLVFQHTESGEQAVVPILNLGEKYLIPDNVLLPGELRVSAISFTKTVDYTSTVTESIQLCVYDPLIKPVDWGAKPAYDVYREFYSMVQNINSSIKALPKDYILKSTLTYTDINDKSQTVYDTEVNTHITKSNEYTSVQLASCTVSELKPGTTYTFKVVYPKLIDNNETETDLVTGKPSILNVYTQLTYVDADSQARLTVDQPAVIFSKGDPITFNIDTPADLNCDPEGFTCVLSFGNHIYF